MLSVADALTRVLALAKPTASEPVALDAADGRVLSAPVAAVRDQPPFAASAMDGYAVRADDAAVGAPLRVVGEAPAGRAWAGALGPGEAVRIFTGAPMPAGADAVLIQENADRQGDVAVVRHAAVAGAYVRPRGLDFAADEAIAAPRRLSPADVALAAAMNAPSLAVHARPRVALVPTGDELILPGGRPRDDQIVASSAYGVAALLARRGARCDLRPIAPDAPAALASALADAAAAADLVVTLGGASVGEHDLVRDAVLGAAQGGTLALHRIAMRPGKPLMAGRIGATPMVGLPGNPVSAMVCAVLFLQPLIDAMQGLPAGPVPRRWASSAGPLPENGPREHYMRARLGPDGAAAFQDQDSSRQRLLAQADVLIVRPPRAPAAPAGAMVAVIDLPA